MKKKMLAAGSVMALSTFLMPQAHASSAHRACDASGHSLNMTIHYLTTANYHEWGYADYILGGAGTGGKSNFNLRMWDGGNLAYSFISPDNLNNDETYTVNWTNFYTKRIHKEVWKGEAIFDISGGDPHCTATLSY